MKMERKSIQNRAICLVIAIILLLSFFPVEALAAGNGQWVNAWSTSPIAARLNELGCLDRLGVTLADVSSRVTITPTASGNYLRLTFSNEFGVTPLTISECTVAKTGSDSRTVVFKTIQKVTFGGKTLKSIPAGRTVTSDPVELTVKAGEKISVTTYFRGINAQRTIGLIGGDTYSAVGNYTHNATMLLGLPLMLTADSGTYQIIPSLIGMDVLSNEQNACSCVVFGDSTVANDIPRLLQKKLQSNGITNVSVTQQAIKGNRLIAYGVGVAASVLGESGVARFERDVLNQTGVKYVIVKLGANDIIHPYCKSKADRLTPVTFEKMVEGYCTLADMAHDCGIKIYFADIAPWKGYTRNILGSGDDITWSEEIDQVRLEINDWFASDDCPADGHISLSCLADPADPFALVPAYTTDGVHFTQLGEQAFVDAVPIEIFK